MRVITGSARGRRLKTLEGVDVRPTADRVKEAIFSVIQFDIEGRMMLDLFAGSGQMGIEALSRGAAKAVFVDSSANAIAVIKENLKSCDLMKSAVVVQSEAKMYLNGCASAGKDKFDVVFLDPPYNQGVLQDVLPYVANIMKDSGVIICESSLDDKLPETAENFAISKEYRYGKIKVTFYRVPRQDDDGGEDE